MAISDHSTTSKEPCLSCSHGRTTSTRARASSPGWTISAITRHLSQDRRTIRAYLTGRQAGVSAPAGPDLFAPFIDYCRARLSEDPHVWAMTPFDEVTALSYDRVYSSFTRQLRARNLRPQCEPRPGQGRPAGVIDHPPGEETHWDCVELPDRPAA
ncbi:hypothetical protein [Blastococcus haudaquaticus]|uniref:hypothetical protein n=1 Tax=Blastococcus haudaquaticus TaxID=1938745 RepID=UPI00117752DB|nr:hypothetical protein [Blastococcus haudaquaticus]